jgi:hypothetical protein
VTVTLSRAMPNATYTAVAGLSGTALGSGTVQGITARTTTTVTVRVSAPTTAVTAGTLTVEVIASAG